MNRESDACFDPQDKTLLRQQHLQKVAIQLVACERPDGRILVLSNVEQLIQPRQSKDLPQIFLEIAELELPPQLSNPFLKRNQIA